MPRFLNGSYEYDQQHTECNYENFKRHYFQNNGKTTQKRSVFVLEVANQGNLMRHRTTPR